MSGLVCPIPKCHILFKYYSWIDLANLLYKPSNPLGIRQSIWSHFVLFFLLIYTTMKYTFWIRGILNSECLCPPCPVYLFLNPFCSEYPLTSCHTRFHITITLGFGMPVHRLNTTKPSSRKKSVTRARIFTHHLPSDMK